MNEQTVTNTNTQPATKTPQQQSAEKLQMIKKATNDLLNNPEVARFLGQRARNFKNTFVTIAEHFKLMGADETVCVGSKTLQEVRDTVNFMKRLIIEEPMTPEFNTFAEVWCELVLNWSRNTVNDGPLNHDCIILSRLARGHYTLFELFEYTKKLLERQKNATQYALPGIELAKHYSMSMTGPGKPSEVPTTGPLLESK